MENDSITCRCGNNFDFHKHLDNYYIFNCCNVTLFLRRFGNGWKIGFLQLSVHSENSKILFSFYTQKNNIDMYISNTPSKPTIIQSKSTIIQLESVPETAQEQFNLLLKCYDNLIFI